MTSPETTVSRAEAAVTDDEAAPTAEGHADPVSNREATTAGTARLVRLALRRDRFRLALWFLGLVALVAGSAASINAVYDTQASIDSYAALVGGNPATVAMSGPGHGFDDPNVGTVLANETSLWTVIGLALMSMFLLVRQTRGDEELGRIELVRSSAVGRHAPLVAAIVVVATANVVTAAAIGVALVAFGFDVTGSFAFATSAAAAGLVFTGVAAVAAQITTTSRSALGIASGALGAAFVLRAVGDVGNGLLTWGSPIGWAQAVRSFGDERWWTIALSLAVAAAACLGALVLESHRDHGGGLLRQRPGPSQGSRWVAHPVGLALRLQRATVVAWTAGVFLLGAVYGSIARDIEQLIEDSPEMADILAQVSTGSLTDAFYATALVQVAVIATGFSLASTLRLRGEETAGRAEPVLATPTGRIAWSGGSLIVTIAATLVVLVAGGLGMGLGNAVMTGDTADITRLIGGAVAYLPAVLVMVGVAFALFGLTPGATGVTWAALGGAIVIAIFGDMLRLPDWVRQVSPFEHVPAVPAEPLAALPLVALGAVAALLLAAGMGGLRARDMA